MCFLPMRPFLLFVGSIPVQQRSEDMKTLLLVTRRAFVVGVAIVGAAGFTSARAQDALRFGLAMPLSGSQALYGQDQVKAAQWGVDEINARGGINGKKLEMIILTT